ncbi:MAG: hypothetical protein WC755_08675 [Candidatus Woesearchaeota archaeon]|jgi:hypothetical protein
MMVLFAIVVTINIPNFNNIFEIKEVISTDFINSTFSIMLGFYLSALLGIAIYNNQNQKKIVDDQNKIIEYLNYLDENINIVTPDKLEEGISVGYLHYDYFDNLQSIGTETQNKKYFKLIGYIKQLKNLFYEIHNANLIDPKNNPIRPDQASLVNQIINLTKNEIKEIKQSYYSKNAE